MGYRKKSLNINKIYGKYLSILKRCMYDSIQQESQNIYVMYKFEFPSELISLKNYMSDTKY